jgi:hypothetical protein
MIMNFVVSPDLLSPILTAIENLKDYEVNKARFVRQNETLAKLTEKLEVASRLLGEVTSISYGSKDFAELLRYKRALETHLDFSHNRHKVRRAFADSIPRVRLYSSWTRLIPSLYIGRDILDLLKDLSAQELEAIRLLDEASSVSQFKYDPILVSPFNIGSRFFPEGATPIAIMADDLSTAVMEVKLRRLGFLEDMQLENNIDWFEQSTVNVNAFRINVDLESIADLSDPHTLASVGLSVSDLTAPLTKTDSLSFTQEVGLTLYEAGFEGIIAPSAFSAGKTDLTLFPSNIRDWSDRVVITSKRESLRF